MEAQEVKSDGLLMLRQRGVKNLEIHFRLEASMSTPFN